MSSIQITSLVFMVNLTLIIFALGWLANQAFFTAHGFKSLPRSARVLSAALLPVPFSGLLIWCVLATIELFFSMPHLPKKWIARIKREWRTKSESGILDLLESPKPEEEPGDV